MRLLARSVVIGTGGVLLSCCLSLENQLDTTISSVVGDTLYLSGTMNSRTFDEIADVISENPQLTRVEIGEIDGSIDDNVTLETGLLIHESGLDTHLTTDSFIESGGVDIFCAGHKRTAERGAHVGVHAWAYNDGRKSGFALDREDEDHAPYLAYFETVGCPVSFYWYTLKAAPAESMYVMSEDELLKEGVVTAFVD